ncbi:hypothetical protein CLF_107046 [Clonorchis sinensis]|uniref:DUF4817 domain-containing protein n=1 Tax=Clonorchis sinensis TaxID=79923 RepID=G7YQD1_CLOSI|nr:hypothetical protein CLF_107046 [Clonorchis sinensis]
MKEDNVLVKQTERRQNAEDGNRIYVRVIRDPFTVSVITRLIATFESTGSVLDFPGKGRKSLSDERAPIVQNAVEQLQSQSTMTSSSITQVSQLTGIPRASVRRIMRRHLHLYPYHFTLLQNITVHRIMRRHLHLYPYHFTLLQNITEEDKEQRVTFANWLLDNEEIVPNILWSDEANFSVDGIINKHNCVIWSREAPHEYLMSNSPIISISLISEYWSSESGVNETHHLLMAGCSCRLRVVNPVVTLNPLNRILWLKSPY